ncbi:MAG: hypothetical protein Q8N88_05420 [Nanoarchaeota archaeon]|nr:hypothetical protein [Nanoarchaeota archaeon]
MNSINFIHLKALILVAELIKMEINAINKKRINNKCRFWKLKIEN